ncbi:MAG: translocation/assembly module TamB domain-containing protein [Pseudomonadota bacterium]
METRTPDVPAEAPVETVVIVDRAPAWRRVIKWAGIVVATLAVLAGAAVLGLNTAPGRAFVARQISNTTLASGLNFRIGRIDGSLYGSLVLRDVEVRDTKGAFATAREIALDWRPFSYFANRIDIRSAVSPAIKLDRMPALKPVPSDPNAPILPDINIDVAKLDLARIEIGPAVTGRRHIGKLAGSVHISDGRAQIDATGGTLTAPGVAGGDLLAVKLDAVPDQDKLDIALRLNAPAGGLVAGLAGVTEPLTFSITGDGSWKNWKGQAVGTLGGGELADLAITAQSGTFHVRGTSQPGLYMKGPVERLTAPQMDVALDVAWSDRKADTRLELRSKALSLTCNGMLDLGASRFGNFRIDALLLTPGAIADNLNGNSVRLGVALNGPFARPVVDYKLQAASLGMGEIRIERLYAEGRARVDANRILVPVHAKAARVAGLSSAGGLVTNLTVDGDLAITGDQILSDNLKLKSDRIDATAILVADISEGRYTGALKGRINEYEIQGLGTVDLATDAKLFAAPGGGWGIRGHVAGRSARIYSEGVRTFLGGTAVATSEVGIDPRGVVTFTQLRLAAPEFRITGGAGRYNPDGTLLLDAEGFSNAYGPITAHVTGPLAAPVVLLKAPKPGLGVGMVNLEGLVKASRTGAYAITAKGDTDYGPFTADVLLQSGRALSVDVRNARFAGMDITGRLLQTAAGPFDGRLDFAGSGVTGHARLGAEGQYQRADFDARALNATIPGQAGLTIGRAFATGSIVLADTPQVVGDAQVANLRSGGFTLKVGRVKIDYRGGSGSAQAFATGSSGVPFRIGASARFTPKEWLVALVGQGNGLNFKTPKPAHIAVDGGTYRLMPTRVELDRGSARIAGTYGKGMTFQTRLDSLDLAVVNAFVPGLGIGGSATGSLDFAQASPSSFPSASARLEIADFTRSSLSKVSTPVNVTFVGKLLPDGGDARALVKRGTTTIGRMVATLRPLGAEAGSWRERLLAAPLSGGIRYNGPATVLFSLAGLSGQNLDGPLGVAADFSGRVRKPELTGIVRGDKLVYENEIYGTRLSSMKIAGRFSNDSLVIEDLTAVAGTGTVKASGTIGLSSAANFPMNISADLNNARLARSDSLAATATGKINVIRDAKGNRVTGQLQIPEARYEVIRQGAAEVAELTGVRRKTDVFQTPEQRLAAQNAGSWDLDLRIRADNQIFISGMGLESEWRANVTIRGTSANPVIGGSATVVRGDYEFAGRRFELTKGTIRWEGREISNPSIEIAASATTEGVTANLNVTGTAQLPRVSFTSTPSLPQDEVVARLLFGSSVTNLSATEAIQLAAALNSLRGTGGGLNPLGKLRSATGISRLRILAADDTTGRGTALAAGQYITDDIYIEVITDARGFTATQLEIALSRALSILSQTGSFGGSSVSVRYRKDY